jgi:ubiquitin-protein ligase
MALKRLNKELKIFKNEESGYYSIEPSEDNFLVWNFIIFGPCDTLYENGLFKGKITFTKDYPIKPPGVKFNNMIHPNVYQTGEVCISILHEGIDSHGYESAIERWSPTHNVNTIMMSIISLLSDPNFDSPANIDASVMWKNKPDDYKKKIYKLVEDSFTK